jgi:hypothetical protein
MDHDLFLIVLITGSQGLITDLRFLLEKDGVCLAAQHRAGGHAAPTGTLKEMQQVFSTRLASLVETEELVSGVSVDLRTLGGDLYEILLPEELRTELEAAASSVDDDEAPVLRIHTEVPWIPWELMHDGHSFLGLRFRIARLPIVSVAPGIEHLKRHAQPRIVSQVCNVLGEHVLDNQLLAAWKETFSGVPDHDVHQRSFPPLVNGALGDYPKSSDIEGVLAETDILHLTCHGRVDDSERVYWTLNDQHTDFWNYEIKEGHVNTWGREEKLAISRPLVFANACFSATVGAGASKLGLAKGFGPRFLSHGATAFVAPFARVTKSLAVQFARQFYQVLLGEAVSIGEALWQVKRAYAANPPDDQRDSSWLFYCLYGHPDTRFALNEE